MMKVPINFNTIFAKSCFYKIHKILISTYSFRMMFLKIMKSRHNSIEWVANYCKLKHIIKISCVKKFTIVSPTVIFHNTSFLNYTPCNRFLCNLGIGKEHKLVHNRRETKKIVVTEEGDGALAVVDIDTLWVDARGHEDRWLGRVSKVYARVGSEWKMTMHTGVLRY